MFEKETPAEVAARFDALETEKKNAEEALAVREKELGVANEELQKYKNKDTNFKHLRDMTADEIARLTEQEKEIIRRQDKLEEDTNNFRKSTVESIKKDALDRLSGGDVELRKKIEFHYDRFAGAVEDKEAVFSRMADAARLAGNGPQSNPLLGALNMGGSGPTREEPKDFTETDKGKSLASALGVPLEVPKQ